MLYSIDRKYETPNQYSGSLVVAMPSRTYPVSLPDFIEVKMITQQELKRLLHYDPKTGVFTWKLKKGSRGVAGKIAGYIKATGYVSIKIDGRAYLAHRLAWLYVYGYLPREVDHISRIESQNMICNLREATHAENSRNSRISRNNTSGYVGVIKSGNRYMAKIKHNYESIHIGVYDTLEEAVEARKLKSLELFGAFAPERISQ